MAGGRVVPDYPPEREDWMMIEEYAKKKSYFGCIYCEKTHSVKNCEHKAKRTVVVPKATYANYKSQYDYEGYGD